MNLIKNIQDWTNAHNPKWLALFRVALGAALLLKGVSLLNNLPDFGRLVDENNLSGYKNLIVDSVPWIHIAGGFLIIIGMFTRFAALIQIPVLLATVLFISSKQGYFSIQTDLGVSLIILFLLLVFILEGSGPLSLAGYFKDEEEEEKKANTAAE
jgi:uncharacterized membrane protein YphA (DoxX/SURF4 family)